jgi:uncharacterized membrane protein YhaH (DUF805 family)
MNAKSWYWSKTLWANVIMLVLSVLDNAYFGSMIPADTKVVIITVLNLALRFLAVQPITIESGK